MGNGQSHVVSGILDNLIEDGDSREKVAFGKAVEAFGHRSYGPFLLFPALLELSPLGGMPGVPTILAAIILLFAIQIVFGRSHLWLPSFITERRVSGDRLKAAMEKMKPLGRWLDRHFHGRLRRFTQGIYVRAAAGLIVALCLAVPPLELIPFASAAPMFAIAMFGLAIMVRDGALMIAATVASLIALGLGGYFLIS